MENKQKNKQNHQLPNIISTNKLQTSNQSNLVTVTNNKVVQFQTKHQTVNPIIIYAFGNAISPQNTIDNPKNMRKKNYNHIRVQTLGSLDKNNALININYGEDQLKSSKSNLKQKYMQLASRQSQLFKYIMSPFGKNQNQSAPKPKIKKKQKSKKEKKNLKQIQKQITQKDQRVQDKYQLFAHKFNQNINQNSNIQQNRTSIIVNLNKTRQFITRNSQQLLNYDRKKLLKQNNSLGNKLSQSLKKINKKSYTVRLLQVKQKKKLLENSVFENTIRKIQQNSLDFRNKRHQQLNKKKKYQKYKDILQSTLQKFIIKNLLLKSLCQPIAQARKLKIDNFARTLKLQRRQKLIRKLFIKNRVKSSMSILKKLKFSTFMTLCHAFKRYVAKRRKDKYAKYRKLIIQQIFKGMMKQKIRIGLAIVQLNVKKIQKLNEWMMMVKMERLSCLRVRWKTHLMSVMKVYNDGESNIRQLIPKLPEDVTFKALYQEKQIKNPNLKLSNFLNNKPIFRLKFEYFEKTQNLFNKKNQALLISQMMINSLNSRKIKIKFTEEQIYENIEENKVLEDDILPYSLHNHVLIKPSIYEINMPEWIKTNEKWIKQEKQILHKSLLSIIEEHQINFLKKKRQYDLQLANFLRSKYDKHSEKRWITIIEYNKLIKTHWKIKRQKQLRRLLNLVGSQYLLDEDCLPEKYLVLEEGLKSSDAPKTVKSTINFGMNQFRKVFKKYIETVQTRLRVFRRQQN